VSGGGPPLKFHETRDNLGRSPSDQRTGEQLEYEGFTKAQAVHGANSVEL